MGQAAANDAYHKDWIRKGWLQDLKEVNRLLRAGATASALEKSKELESKMREYVNRPYEY